MARRTGRRPGNPDTREAILAAARTAFATRGYDAASLRAIAAEAGVDPALIHHYFGSKEKLFLATVDVPIDPAELVPRIVAGDRDHIGERLVRTLLALWDSPAGTAAAALLRSAMSSDWGARMLREFVTTQILRRIMRQLDISGPEAELRVSLVASQVVGMIITRRILRIEPLASTPVEVLIAAIGPTVQRYLTGDIAGAGQRVCSSQEA